MLKGLRSKLTKSLNLKLLHRHPPPKKKEDINISYESTDQTNLSNSKYEVILINIAGR